VTDSNPPLYFSLLFVVRQLITDNRAAILALNVFFLFSATLSAWLAFGGPRFTWVLLFFCLFALGGPGAAYIAEGRSYFLAMCIVSFAVVLMLFAIETPGSSPRWWVFAVTGALASLTHVFAGLLCCSLAAAVTLSALRPFRRHLIVQAVVLFSASVVAFSSWSGGWLFLGPRSFTQVGWIPFTFASVSDALLGVLAMTYGRPILVLPFAACLLAGLFFQTTRQAAAVVIVSVILFVVIPILASFLVPIILARYWLVGAPMLLAGLIYLLRNWAQFGGEFSKATVIAGASYIAVTTSAGYLVAYRLVASKPIWRGTSIVAPVTEQCGPRSIRVLGFLPGFSIVTKAPPDTFVDVQKLTGSEPLAEQRCPVLGWSEHYILRFGPGFMQKATDEELLKLLKINLGPNDNIHIEKHESGFVVRRAS
jgi:hypothetical protein